MPKSRRTLKCPNIPYATYRLQLNRKFPLKLAKKLIPYLKELGISHIYASPLLRARSGSMHCYDVVSHKELNPEIGSLAEFEEFSELLTGNGMGLLLDIVPNHMSTSFENKLWLDILERGPYSEYANFFDIDWDAPIAKHKVILPILGSRLEDVLKSGQLQLVSDPANRRPVCVELYGMKLPISLESYVFILEQIFKSSDSITIINEIIDVFKGSQQSSKYSTAEVDTRSKRIVNVLTKRNLQRPLKIALANINERIKNGHDWESFRKFLDLQHYALEYWRDAMNRINYRRFVYVNDLVAIRADDESVFKESHSLIQNWIESGLVQALRVDHVDGLKNPVEYLKRLKNLFYAEGKSLEDPYVVIEKILIGKEMLPHGWDISGTTGYDFIYGSNELFVVKDNEKTFSNIYKNFTGLRKGFESVALDSRRTIAEKFVLPDINRLIRIAFAYKLPKRFSRVSESNLRRAIEKASIYFPVYRTYATEAKTSTKDTSCIRNALSRACNELGLKDRKGLDLLGHLLLSVQASGRLRYEQFCTRFQQLTPTIAAKGLEDTAFYRYHPLSSLNEVGGNPSEFGLSVRDFHSKNLEMARHWPNSMVCSSTHDTKWSEDSRARLNVLSEIPREWSTALTRWSVMNRAFKTVVGRHRYPTRNDEYLFYEAILASLQDANSLPVSNEFMNRIVQFMRKASKEEKRETDWIDSNPEYDAALERFARRVLSKANSKFQDDVMPLLDKVRIFGCYNSLSQLLLKLTCPGVPDIYQGCETWNLSMVDPDNRYPVNYEDLTRKLRSISHVAKRVDLARNLLSRLDDGTIKMYLLQRVLNFRRENQALFNFGAYIPLTGMGKNSNHVISYAREYHDSRVIVVVPRFLSEICDTKKMPVGNVWKGTYVKLPKRFEGEYANIFTQDKSLVSRRDKSILDLSLVFGKLPFCLFSKVR